MAEPAPSARGSAMGDRLCRTAVEAGLRPPEARWLVRAFEAALGRREPEDPSYLHPGRTALILLDDLGERDVRVLLAGVLADSREPHARLSPGSARAVIPPGAGEALTWLRALPVPDWGAGTDPDSVPDGLLVERLLESAPAVARIALAEALDQVRHAHLWPDPVQRAAAGRLAEGVFAPLAPRFHPVLERRFAWWVRRVGRRLRAGSPGQR